MVPPPFDVISPPQVAVVLLIFVAAAVVNTGKVVEPFDVESEDFLQPV
jgi:hypothetical protein